MEVVLVIMVLASFAIAGGLAFAQRGEPPAPGQRAPDFRLAGTDGEMHDLAACRGRRAVVVFHPQDDTPECIAFIARLGAAARQIEDGGAWLAAVVLSEPEAARGYHEVHAPHVRVLCDPRGRTARAYGCLVNLVLLRFPRKLIVLVGPSGMVERTWRDAVDPGSVDELLAALGIAQPKV